MVIACVAFGCTNRFRKDSKIKFFRFPTTDDFRRRRWVIALRRANFEPYTGSRICSAHFITGAPSKDPKHPDYIPSVFVFTDPTKLISMKKLVKEYAKKIKKEFDNSFKEMKPEPLHTFHVAPFKTTADRSLKNMKLALIQLAVTASKEANLQKAETFIRTAAQNGANLVCLPECFNTPYGVKFFSKYAESIPGVSSNMLSRLAKENQIHLVGGSLPEASENKLYNTCLVYGPDGKLLTKFRKVHLFDIDIPGKITFQESSVLSSGNSLETFKIGEWNVGLGICYDIRFALMANVYAAKGCQLLLYPGAFNMTTGPAHWELLQRARAVDNQLYVAAISPARDDSKDSPYVAWGHSSVVSPWGDVIATTDEKEGILYCEIDLSKVNEFRSNLPLSKQSKLKIALESTIDSCSKL